MGTVPNDKEPRMGKGKESIVPFCPRCGAGIPEQAAYCPSCGNSFPGANRGAAAGQGKGLETNIAAALTYVLGFVTGILFLLWDPYRRDRFVRFHAFQSIAYSVAYLVFWTIYSRIVLFGLFTFGPLWSILSILGTLISLAAFLFWLFLMYKAYNYAQYRVPFLGEFAAKQAG
jgi:uncharacterized membrane protein